MTNKLEELKKEMEDVKVAHNALDAHNAAHAAAYAAYNNELNKQNEH